MYSFVSGWIVHVSPFTCYLSCVAHAATAAGTQYVFGVGKRGGRDLWHLGNSRLEVVAVLVRMVGAASIISLLKETGLLSWVSPLDITTHTHGHTAQSQNLERKNTHIYPSWPVMAPGANAIQRLVCLWSTLRLCTALDVQIWQHRVHSCSFNRHIKKTTLCKDSKTAVTCSRSSHPFSDHQRNERKHMEILLF